MAGARSFDLVVLGSGSTAFAAALKAAELGATAVLTEARVVGGTCVNRGCVPSKYLIAAAADAAAKRNAPFPGVISRGADVDVEALLRGKDAAVARMQDKKYGSVAAASQAVEILQGRARLLPDGEVRVGETRLKGRAVLVATGSRPSIPDIPGLAESGYWTSDILGRVEDGGVSSLPESLVILGGGYIGCELGQAFQRLGVEVTVVTRSRRLLPRFEPQVGDLIGDVFRREGIGVETESQVIRVERMDGGVGVVLRDAKGSERRLEVQRILVATGRRPNTDALGLDEAGVETDAEGFVVVDPTLQTTRPGVWAAGDVVRAPMATPVGAQQGALVAENTLAGAAHAWRGDVVPRAVFTDPPVASVGLTDAEAKERGIARRCRTTPLEHVPRAAALGATEGFVKIVAAQEDERIIGVTLVAEAAHEIIHEAAMAMRFGAKLKDLIEQIHVYPTMAEALKIGALAFHKDVSKLSCCAE